MRKRASFGSRSTKAAGNTLSQRENELALPSEFHELVKKFAGTDFTISAFETIGGDFQIINTPYNLSTIIKLPVQNQILKQCIEVYVDNIDGAGYTLEYIGEEGQEESAQSQLEKESLLDILELPNANGNIIDLRKKLRSDHETVGYCTTEVLMNVNNEIAGFNHIPSQYIRKTKRDKEHTSFNVYNPATGKTKKVHKRFCRYVQKQGLKNIFFKEYGDPRMIDYATGKETTNKKRAATAIIMEENYTTGFDYGLPRWINQLPSVIGSRSAELVNADFFKENAIPAMALLVGGGQLSLGSVENIKDRIDRKRGRSSMNDIMILEAFGDENAADDQGRIAPPSIKMESMVDNRQTDAFFENYEKQCEIKIRSGFRFGSIFLGKAEDLNYASSLNSVNSANTFVFRPIKREVDNNINNRYLRTPENMPSENWRYKTSSIEMPRDSGDMEGMLRVLNEVGALTPNFAIDITNDMFGTDVKKIKEEWGNEPFVFATNSYGTSNTEEIEEVKKIVSDSRMSDDKKTKVLKYIGGENK